jgi:hypothetical protein
MIQNQFESHGAKILIIQEINSCIIKFDITELSLQDDNLLKRIVPSGYSPQIIGENRNFQLSSLFHKVHIKFYISIVYMAHNNISKV